MLATQPEARRVVRNRQPYAHRSAIGLQTDAGLDIPEGFTGPRQERHSLLEIPMHAVTDPQRDQGEGNQDQCR